MGPRKGEEESIYQLGGAPPPSHTHRQQRGGDPGAACGPRIVETEAPRYAQRQQQAPVRPMHRDSSQMGQFLNPVGSGRESQRRRGVAPVDHSRNNRNAIREAR